MIKSLSLLTLTLLNLAVVATQAVAQIKFSEDDLVTVDGLPWAAPNWVYNELLLIQKFGGGVVGRGVLDRDGRVSPIDGNLLMEPFSKIKPVTTIVISAWTSKNDGCYMDMLVQRAVESRSKDIDGTDLIPLEVTLMIGDQYVTLTPQPIEGRAKSSGPFSATYYHSRLKQDELSKWYTGRNTYTIKAEQAAMLTSAKPSAVTVRVVLTGSAPYQYEIGEGTVRRWKEVFNYNPKCRLDRPAQSPISKEALNTFKAQYLTQPIPKGGGARLDDSARKARQNYQNEWAKTNEPAARFLGAWFGNNSYFYVYPSKIKGKTCVITQTGKTAKFQIGQVTNQEMQFQEGSFFWVNQPEILAARTNTAELYPVYAIQALPTLTAPLIGQLNQEDCAMTLPGKEFLSQLNHPPLNDEQRTGKAQGKS